MGFAAAGLCLLLTEAAALFSLWLLDVPVRSRTAAVITFAAAVCGTVFGYYLPLRVVPVLSRVRFLALQPAFFSAAVFDWKTRKIPNFIPVGLAAVFVLCFLAELLSHGGETAFAMLTGGLAAGAAVFAFLVLCRFLAKGGLGYGDVKLMGTAALLLGLYGTIHLLVFAELSALAYAAWGLLTKRLTLKSGIPFAPFFLIGFQTIVVLGLF